MLSVEEELLIEETELSDDEVGQDFRYTIMTYPADYTLRSLYEKWQADQLVIPEFQRNYIWTQTQASRLIESFLLGLPVPQVFLHRNQSESELTVIDGHHRLGTIARFFTGDFRLKGVDSRWEGCTYETLIEHDKLALDESTLRAVIIRQILDDDNSVMHQIFLRLNTGGTQLNDMEIRRAMFGGAVSNFLERLNENPDWRAIIGMPQPAARYRDLELILRILALAEDWQGYRKPMREFINRYMQILDSSESEEIEPLADRFEKACSIVLAELGEKPFHLQGRLNRAALDSLMGCLVAFADSLEGVILDKYQALLGNEAFWDSVTRNTSDDYVVQRRFEMVHEALGLR